GQETTLDQENVVHIQQVDPYSDTYGLATLRAAGSEVDISNSIRTAQKYGMDNAFFPPAIISGKMGKEVKEELKKDLMETNMGPTKGRAFLLAREHLDIKPFMLTPVEVDYIQSLEFSYETLAVALDVDPVLIGLSKRATYENKHAAQVAIWADVHIPHLVNSRDQINLQLLPQMDLKDGSFLDFDLSRTPAVVDMRKKNAEEAAIYLDQLHASPRAVNARLNLGFSDDDLPKGALVPMSLVYLDAPSTERPAPAETRTLIANLQTE
ncbi:unnamed protein product, partial [marine sediment metagenome]